MHLRHALLAVCLAGVVAAPVALAGDGSEVRGTSFELDAAAGTASVRGEGTLDAEALHGGSGAVVVTRAAGRRKQTLVLEPTRWRVEVSGPVATLVLRVRVGTSSARTSCPVGSRGTVRLVAAGSAGDTVAIAFRRPSCRVFAGAWSSEAGDEARVGISVIHR